MNKFTNKIRWAVVIAILAFVHAGCGGSSSSGGGGEDQTPVTSTVFKTEPLADLAGATFSAGVAISDAGTAVGYSDNGTSVSGVRWDVADPESATELAPLQGNSYSAAYGVNLEGIIVGESGISIDEQADANTVAVFWEDDSAFALPNLNGHNGTYAAYSINSFGLIVGESSDQDGNTFAVLWDAAKEDAEVTSLHDALEWEFSAAYYIHDDGIIVGEAKPMGANSQVQAVIWTPSSNGFVSLLLPPADGDSASVAFGVDAFSRIVGESENGSSLRGMIWTVDLAGTEVVSTQVLDDNTSAQFINDNNRVVGYSDYPNNKGKVWNRANLNDKVEIAPPFSMALGVNNSTQIVGILDNQAFVTIPQ